MHAQFLPQLFNPCSIAIVGASERNPYARSALQRLEACGFAGRVQLVNPRRPEVFGRKAWQRASELPEPIDMAFICVPAPMALDALQDCAARGAKAAVVISSGFAESHETGGMAIKQGSEMDSLTIAFSTDQHTATMVPIFAYGPGAELFSGIFENTEVFFKMQALFGFPATATDLKK